MKNIALKIIQDTPIFYKAEVVIEMLPEEANELFNAVSIIEKYKQQAKTSIKLSEFGEWKEFEFKTCPDGDCVICEISTGMIG